LELRAEALALSPWPAEVGQPMTLRVRVRNRGDEVSDAVDLDSHLGAPEAGGAFLARGAVGPIAPHDEVEVALNISLLGGYGVPGQVSSEARSLLPGCLQQGDAEGMRAVLHALFAGIPHDWYRNNPLAGAEGHYASVFYSYLVALGYDVRVEDATNKGRIDLALRLDHRVYLFEFKVVEQVPDGRALDQLQARGYAEKYRAPDTTVTLVGVEFSREARNLVGFEVLEA
jgi:hypothetical protein